MKTSSHMSACNIAASESHNKREKELDYVRKDLTKNNESFSYIAHSLQTEEANIKREVKEKTKRKLQKNAIPIKESCVVIKSDTTMEELKDFCEECRREFGIIPLQIHIHRDEGHVNSKTWKPNLHAHIVWRMYDKEGRNVRLQRADLSKMQDIAAYTLHMERGKKSNKEHQKAIEFKIQQETERLERLEKKRDKVEQEVFQLEKDKNTLSYEVGELTKQKNDTIRELHEITTEYENKSGLKTRLEALQSRWGGKGEQKYLEERKRREKAEKEVKFKDATIANMEYDRRVKGQMAKELATNHNRMMEESRTAIDRANNLDGQLTALSVFYKEAETMGLTLPEANKLRETGKLQKAEITTENGTNIKFANGEPIRFEYGFMENLFHNKIDVLKVLINHTWMRVNDWFKAIRESSAVLINGRKNDIKTAQGYKFRR